MKASKRQCRQKFTQDEDRIIFDQVSLHGEKDWVKIAQSLPSRSSRQIRERWKNYLSPSLKHDPWSLEEDELLRRLIIQYGQQWSKIAAHFPGRTDVIIKNRWCLLKRRTKRII